MMKEAQAKSSATTQRALTLQRKCACGTHTIAGGECEGCDEKRLQRRAMGPSESTEAPPIVREVLSSPGRPLDAATRSFMEPRFAHDFSRVRVHTDARAAESAHAVNALAYTVGRDVVFGQAQYAPTTTEGRRLLAHELTHVVQQRVAPPADMTRKTFVASSSSPLEAEADRTADSIISGRAWELRTTRPVAPAGSLQRQPAAAPAVKEGEPKEQKEEEMEKKEKKKSPAPGCVEEAVGKDPDSLPRMDTVTVVELGAEWCHGCKLWLADLAELCSEFAAKPDGLRFRVYSIDHDLEENAEVVKRIKQKSKIKSIPQVFIYTDHELSAFYDSYEQGGVDYKAAVRKIYKSAATPGVFKGMKLGSIIGGVVGGVVGTIAGAVLGGFGGAVLGGVIGGAAGAALGIGLGSAIGAIFGNSRGTSPLSEKRLKEVREYMYGSKGAKGEEAKAGLHQRKTIQGDSSGDDLARDVVNQWVERPREFPLDIMDRRLLIMEMLDGYLSTTDQRGILKVLENSSDTELLQIVNKVGVTPKDDRGDGFSFADLKGRFSGDELKYLNDILERLRDRFPVDAPLGETEGRWIDRGDVKAKMKGAYEATQKQQPAYAEVAALFMDSGNPDNPHYHEHLFKGTTSFMYDVWREAAQRFGKGKSVLASFHTHPGIRQGDEGRSAPSASDLKNAIDNPMMGNEHYVIDAWVVYLITKKGGLTQVGKTDVLLGVKPPPVPKGVRSTLELG